MLHSHHLAAVRQWCQHGKVYTANSYQVSSFYSTGLPTRLLLPPLTCNCNKNCLWQKKLVQNLCYLLSSSLVYMVVPHLLQWSFIHCFEGMVSLNVTCITMCWMHGWELRVIKQWINLHFTHIIWPLSVSAVNTRKCKPQINTKLHYTTQVSFLQALLPPLTCNFNKSLQQEMNTEPVTLP